MDTSPQNIALLVFSAACVTYGIYLIVTNVRSILEERKGPFG